MDWKHYFRFAPRANRLEFACVGALWQGLGLISLVLQTLVLGKSSSLSAGALFSSLLLSLAQLALSILMAWLAFASFSRRLHDMNLSAWWIAGYIIPVTGVSLFFQEKWWLFTLLGLIVWLFLCFKKGSPDENRFGSVTVRRQEKTPLLIVFAVLGLLFALGQTFYSRCVLMPRALSVTQQMQFK